MQREDELAGDDIDLSAAEALGEDAVLDAAQQFGGIVVAAAHEGVGHPRHRRVGIAFAAPVAGGGDAHQPRVEPVLHVALEDAVLDQHVLLGRRALVVDRQRAAAVQRCCRRRPRSRPARRRGCRCGRRRRWCPCG